MAKNTQKNQMPCNKQARQRYKERNFKYQTVCFKIEELEAINNYCMENDIPKNTFFREVTMEAIGKSAN